MSRLASITGGFAGYAAIGKSGGVSVPGAPTIGSVTLSGTTASVPFTAPASNGGATITSYTAVSSPGSLTGTLNQAGSGTISVTGLTIGTAYTFTVYATNSAGNSLSSSASNSVTPAATATTISISSTPNQVKSIAVDASNNIYSIVGGSGTNYYTYQGRTSAGAVSYSYNYPAQAYLWPQVVAIERANTSAIDATAVYAFGVSDTSTTTYVTKGELIKFNNSTGAISYKVRLGSGSATLGNDIGGGGGFQMSADHTGPVVFSYYLRTIIKFSTTLALSWQKSITGLTSATSSAVCQRETNTYMSVQHWGSGVAGGAVILKWTSGGTLAWQRWLYPTSSSTYTVYESMDVDGSNNVLLGGRGSYPVATSGAIVSLSSTGSTNWGITISSTMIESIHYSSSHNAIYATGRSGSDLFVIKLNTSGTVLWKRLLTGVTVVGYSHKAYTSTSDSTYFYICTGGTIIFKLNGDGTTVTMGSASFVAASNSTATYSPNNVAGPATVAAGAATSAAATTTASTIAVTQTVTSY